MIKDYQCANCGLELWVPVVKLKNSHVGLYNDARFPGRLIVALNKHEEIFDELDSFAMKSYMEDIQLASQAIRSTVNSERINMAILGNAEPHVHAHLIPRFPDLEEKPNSSPWDDPRPRQKLDEKIRDDIVKRLRLSFTSLNDKN